MGKGSGYARLGGKWGGAKTLNAINVQNKTMDATFMITGMISSVTPNDVPEATDMHVDRRYLIQFVL